VSIFTWNQRVDYHSVVLAEHVQSASLGWTSYQDAVSAGLSGDPTVNALVAAVIEQQANTLAVNDTYLMYALIIILLIPILWLARPPFQPAQANTPH
jgi:DHA2 family multidrug resistance protein